MKPYKTWTSKYDDHKPPYWRNGMDWCVLGRYPDDFSSQGECYWMKGYTYAVSPEAIDGEKLTIKTSIPALKSALREYSEEELEEHGIKIKPDPDPVMHLLIQFLQIGGWRNASKRFCENDITYEERQAIQYVRDRLEEMKGGG